MVNIVRYQIGSLIYTYCRVIAFHILGRCIEQAANTLWHMRKLPHNTWVSDLIDNFEKVTENLVKNSTKSMEGDKHLQFIITSNVLSTIH